MSQIPEDLQELYKAAYALAECFRQQETGVISGVIEQELGEEFDLQCGIHGSDFEPAVTVQKLIERIAALQAELDALRRENAVLKAPVSDEEWEIMCYWIRQPRGIPAIPARKELNAIIAARVAQATEEK